MKVTKYKKGGKTGDPKKMAYSKTKTQKTPVPLKKKGPATDKIKNLKANLEAKKLNASSLPRKKSAVTQEAFLSARRRKLKPSGYKPQPKAAPKALRKIKGYEEYWDEKAGKYSRRMLDRGNPGVANRARVYRDKQDAKKKR